MPVSYLHNRSYKHPWQHALAALLIAEGYPLVRALERAGWGRSAQDGIMAIRRSTPLIAELERHGFTIELLRRRYTWQCEREECAKWNYSRVNHCRHCGRVNDFEWRKVRKVRSEPAMGMMRTPELLRKLSESEQLSPKFE